MKLPLPVQPPFSFAKAVAFLRRFPPCQGEYLLANDAITAAVAIDGRAVAFTIRADLTVDSTHAAAVARAAHFLGTEDDVAGFYRAAKGDAALAPVIDALYGLHHVRFLTLGEIAVYAVMMQRSSIVRAAQVKRRFLERFGIAHRETGLRAWPELPALAALEPEAIGDAIGHAAKGEQIARAVRGVAALGEPFLRDAPYAEAREQLLAIPGIGPFSAGAILLRGLGRMDELPWHDNFAHAGRAIYGDRFDPAALVRRYGRHIGYWAFYAMARDSRIPSTSDRWRRPAIAAGRTASRSS